MSALDKYVCSKCGVAGVKLWRQTNVFACDIHLLCAACSVGSEDLAPAVPDKRPDMHGGLPEHTAYWGASCVPPSGCTWWREQPASTPITEEAWAKLEVECHRLELLEAAERVERQKESDARFARLFAQTECVVEATSFEQQLLWETHSNESPRSPPPGPAVDWEQEPVRFFSQIGELEGRPVCISCSWARIGRRAGMVMFWEQTSEVTDALRARDWVRMRTSHLEVDTDAQNFHLVLRHVRS